MSSPARPLALLAASGGLLLSGCLGKFEGYDQTGPAPRPSGAVALPADAPSPETFPLRPGDRLRYRARFGLGAGLFTGEATVGVTDAWLGPDGREWSAVSVLSRYLGQTRQARYAFAREPGRIGLLEAEPAPHLTWFLPDPPALGAALRIETGEGPGTVVVEAVGERVQVPVGSFSEAARVRFTAETTPTRVTLWLVPRVGMVAAEVAMRVGLLPLVARLELVERAPAPPPASPHGPS